MTVEIGDDTFEFYTENREVDGGNVGFAWSPTAEDDARLIAAMKTQGSNAIVTGVSARGTTTSDTFLLCSAFTASVEDAEARCTN